MRITQGTFSYLPALTDDEIAAQVPCALARGWAVAVRLAVAPAAMPSGWPMVPPPNCSTTSSPR